ncbi:MAG: DNA polymerase III subunit beta [Proteobacteria bacterium]|nr:DNA polymerase III subunit beta [Pseudomonadota bacterium]MBU1736820.1 DNA polymerase III subunit beta [Pseudomonadota bacterium]
MSLSINVSRDEFLAGLSSVQNVTGKKGTIAILSNVLIQTGNSSIILTATDLEVGIRVSIPAEIMASGEITLPARKLFEIVRETAADTLHLELHDNNWVKISANSSDYNLAGMAATDFPSFPEYDESSLVQISASSLQDLVDRTIFSVAQEGESQFNLTGLLVEKDKNEEGKSLMRMVSSDGHRLSLMQIVFEHDLEKLKINKTTLIPRKGVQEIRKFCESCDTVAIGFENNQAVLKSDNSLMIIRLMNGDFPDYRNIINIIGQDSYIEIDRISLINSLKRMILFTEDRFNAVKFHFDKNVLMLSSESMDIGNAKDILNIDYHGPVMTLGFNGKYFVEAMQVMSSEMIRAYINSEESPCLIKGSDDTGYISVVMPMKI